MGARNFARVGGVLPRINAHTGSSKFPTFLSKEAGNDTDETFAPAPRELRAKISVIELPALALVVLAGIVVTLAGTVIALTTW
jgi:hypothetical protein